MIGKLAGLTRQVVGEDRRRHRRRHQVYDVVIRDEGRRLVFRGKTADVSRSGARLAGFPVGIGVFVGQEVHVEFLLLPRDKGLAAQRVPVSATVCRVDETEDAFDIAVRFARPLVE